MPLKIAMIGAGSIGFTRRLMGDLLTVPEKSAADRRHLRRARCGRPNPPREYRYETTRMKRNFSGLTLKEAMQSVRQQELVSWKLQVPPLAPTEALLTHLNRLSVFDLTRSEAAKVLLIDALVAEAVFLHPGLKVWKSEPLESDTLVGVADYLIAPKRAYVETPLLCVVEAKRDDFEQGRVQCVAELAVCRWNNQQQKLDLDVYGIVSNGQGWVFYKLTREGAVFETGLFTTQDLPKLLGALNHVCAECAKNIPRTTHP